MSSEPPPFQESSRCDVCQCSFNTFRRRHHCRCCGRTLCAEHSSNQMALPQFGLHSHVRVCSDCFNDASRAGKLDAAAPVNGVNVVTDSISRLDISEAIDTEARPTVALGNPDCKCGMPLCICEAPSRDIITTMQTQPISTSTVRSSLIMKKAESTPKNRGSPSNSKHSLGQATNSSSEKPLADYEVNGEAKDNNKEKDKPSEMSQSSGMQGEERFSRGLREAIKNGDIFGVRKLLAEGVDANYCDKQGFSLCHLAAVFNQTEIAFMLMENGASVDCKNLQGETPLDCAPVTLQFKMKKKMEEIKQLKAKHVI